MSAENRNSQQERVLITGGTHGIGAAIAQRCREDGFDVVILDKEGDEAIHCDLSDSRATAEVLESILADGPITRLVNNVGAVFPASLEDQTLESFESAVSLNLRTAFQCTQALAPGMIEQNFGRIVTVSSRAALGKLKRTAYSATKAGLIGMTRTWALELGAYGITSNAVAPGPIATDLFLNANPTDSPETQRIIESVPVKKMGKPEDVAHAASYFLDERTGFVTGQTAYVCGGITVGLSDV